MPIFFPTHKHLIEIIKVVNQSIPFSYYDLHAKTGIDGVELLRIIEQYETRALFKRTRKNRMTHVQLSKLGIGIKDMLTRPSINASKHNYQG